VARKLALRITFLVVATAAISFPSASTSISALASESEDSDESPPGIYAVSFRRPPGLGTVYSFAALVSQPLVKHKNAGTRHTRRRMQILVKASIFVYLWAFLRSYGTIVAAALLAACIWKSRRVGTRFCHVGRVCSVLDLWNVS
jgi:hypothetical protein